MTRILIAGLKEPPGGVENAVLSYTENFGEDTVTDFVFLSGEISFSHRIKNGSCIYLPNRVKHPLRYRKMLRELFRKGNYDALWCNYSGLTNIDFLKEAKKQGVKLRIVHAHTSKLSWGNSLMKYLVPFFHNRNQKKIDLYTTDFWACSEKSAVFMFGERLSEKTKIIPNTVDTEKFIKNSHTEKEVREEFGISENTLVLGHVGRMCREKNQRFLLDILKETVKKHPDTVLLFVGDGELREEVVSYAKEISISDNVIFTYSRTDVPRILQAMDVFLLPSLTEGFPVTLVEAQAADIPSVVSSEAIVKEVNLTDTITFLSLEDDMGVWAKKILEASEKECSGGRDKLISKGFDSKTTAKKTESFFKGEK